MAGRDTDLQQFLAEEVNKYQGVAVPVRVSFLRRKLTKRLPVSKLHPNPDDEFCFPEIGPSMAIIARYEKEFRSVGNSAQDARMAGSAVHDPIQVQKIRPDGYMILNGHHRWAAAMRTGPEDRRSRDR